MSESRETTSELNRTYQAMISIYRKDGLEVTMAEAAQLRRILVEVQNDVARSLDEEWTGESTLDTSEVEARFFMEAFGARIKDHSWEYSQGLIDFAEFKERMRDLYAYLNRLRIRWEIGGEDFPAPTAS